MPLHILELNNDKSQYLQREPRALVTAALEWTLLRLTDGTRHEDRPARAHVALIKRSHRFPHTAPLDAVGGGLLCAIVSTAAGVSVAGGRTQTTPRAVAPKPPLFEQHPPAFSRWQGEINVRDG